MIRSLHPNLDRATSRLRVKVCCIGSIAEAELALAEGADALGLVSSMPSGPGVIADEDIVAIANGIGARAASVLLTSRQTADGIRRQLDQVRPTILQLVDVLTNATLSNLRAQHPGVAFMPVVHVRGTRSVDEAIETASRADALLLDSGNPTARVKELGGTGRVHDWRVSRAICDAVPVPVFLAGGLRAENVAEAIRTVRPFGVDVCSGVRTDGRLDRAKLRAFIATAR